MHKAMLDKGSSRESCEAHQHVVLPAKVRAADLKQAALAALLVLDLLRKHGQQACSSSC